MSEHEILVESCNNLLEERKYLLKAAEIILLPKKKENEQREQLKRLQCMRNQLDLLKVQNAFLRDYIQNPNNFNTEFDNGEIVLSRNGCVFRYPDILAHDASKDV